MFFSVVGWLSLSPFFSYLYIILIFHLCLFYLTGNTQNPCFRNQVVLAEKFSQCIKKNFTCSKNGKVLLVPIKRWIYSSGRRYRTLTFTDAVDHQQFTLNQPENLCKPKEMGLHESGLEQCFFW